MTNIDLRELLGVEMQCPTCKHGALKTDADRERGHCDACHLMQGTGFDYHAAARQAFRSEADAYGEGIYDDD